MVLLAALFFPGSVVAVVIATAGLVVIALWKETLWDPVHETDEPFGYEGAQDFAFYLVGLAAGFGLLELLHAVRGLPL